MDMSRPPIRSVSMTKVVRGGSPIVKATPRLDGLVAGSEV